jgi:DNA topoisomerase VI subunit B
MQKQNEDFTKKSIEVDSRALKIQSQQAIRSVIDALVELITNSDDAYGTNSGKIIIEIKRQRDVIVGQVIVKDRAGGLTLEEMKSKILKYGGFSAADKSRGFMGRGPRISLH